jgi:hypothetical protein
LHLVRRKSDFFSGLIFFVIGAAAVTMGLDYPLGTARNMGPGGFPVIIASLLALCGLVLFGRAFTGTEEEPIKIAPLPLLLVSGGIAVFALVLMGAGLVLATMALVLLSSAASGRFRPVSALLLAVGLAVGCTAGFVYGLGQILPVFGRWFTPLFG